MRRKEFIIPAVASAAAALVSGVAVGLISKIRYGLKVNVIMKDLQTLKDLDRDLNERLDELEMYATGFDPDDFIFEEDNEDE